MIERDKLYRIRGNSDYFREKYETPNPIISDLREDIQVWGCGWREHDGPACTIYGWRNGVELLPIDSKVYYGHVLCDPINSRFTPNPHGEVVHKSELEPYEGEWPKYASSENITFENLDLGLFSKTKKRV